MEIKEYKGIQYKYFSGKEMPYLILFRNGYRVGAKTERDVKAIIEYARFLHGHATAEEVIEALKGET